MKPVTVTSVDLVNGALRCSRTSWVFMLAGVAACPSTATLSRVTPSGSVRGSTPSAAPPFAVGTFTNEPLGWPTTTVLQ